MPHAPHTRPDTPPPGKERPAPLLHAPVWQPAILLAHAQREIETAEKLLASLGTGTEGQMHGITLILSNGAGSLSVFGMPWSDVTPIIAQYIRVQRAMVELLRNQGAAETQAPQDT